jgi:heptosyltransferase-1
MKRILLVKTSSMGDVIHNLPVVNDILQHHPEAQIDWVVEESFAEIPRLHPNVSQVFTVAMRRWRKAIFTQNTWLEIKKCKRLLSQQPYDFIIDTQGLIKSAIISTWANGARYGYDKNSIREPYASYFYQHNYAISYQHHAVVRNRTLAAMSLGYAVPTGAPDYGLEHQGLEKHGITTQRNLPPELQASHLSEDFFVALHGTSKESKLWPEKYWINLGQQLAKQQLVLLLPWSSQAEFERAKRIAEKVSSAIVLPKLSITALATIIAKAKIVIGVDTGLSHLAAALDVPTIALYTDSNPLLTGVMAGNKVPAINLGGKGNVPSMEDVLEQVNIFQT